MNGKTRPSWDSYFMTIANATALRSTCPRRQVGCVIVDESKKIVSTGYNGTPKGFPHCTDKGCLIGSDGKCAGAIHAETNAILAANNLHDVFGVQLYCTDMPCLNCFKLIIAAGIRQINFEKWYECPYRDAFIRMMPPEDTLIIRRWESDLEQMLPFIFKDENCPPYFYGT